MRHATPLALSLLLCAASSHARVNARMLRTPDISQDRVAFVYAGDIWVAPKTGGVAERLSTPAGEELFPRFSPDGAFLAFTGNYDGNGDVYVVPTGGGVPTRLTHHPDFDRVVDWHPDGKRVLLATPMTAGKDRYLEFYLVPREGGLPEKLPIPYGAFGAISPDGKTLAYTPQGRDFSTWKRYRGGWNSHVWLFGLDDHRSQDLTKDGANDEQPMWHGGTLYFLSDRGEKLRSNIWARDLKSGRTRQVTHFTDYDARFPAIGPSDIVFEQAGRLMRLDLSDESLHEIPVEVVTDRATLKARVVNVSGLVQSLSISPKGKRVAVEARGEVFTVPAEHGPIPDITRTSGVAERTPTWSPDGKQLAYWSDATGEYELVVRSADGKGDERVVTKLGPGFRYTPQWSPDGKTIAFVDQAMRIRIVDVASGKVTDVDKGLWMFEGELQSFQVSWSRDSRWMAYSRGIESTQPACFLYDTKEGKLHQVTSGFYQAMAPAFDPGGKYLYLLTNRTFRPTYSDLDNTWVYANTTNVAAVPLRKDVKSPLAPRNDVEGEGEDEDEENEDGEKDGKKDDEKGSGSDRGKKPGSGKDEEDEGDDEEDEEEKPPEPVLIDVEGFEERLVVLPLPAGNYGDLAGVEGKVVVRRFPASGTEGKASLVQWDLEKREEKTILDDVRGVELSRDGKKALVAVEGGWAIVSVEPDQKVEKKLRTGELEMTLDPPAEWRQIFTDAWRLERDFFYDPNMHGVDWAGLRTHYGKLLDDCVTRWDVNWVIGELIGELNSSHTYRGGGDTESPVRRESGLLGVDFEIHSGAYRIARILRGAPWDSEIRSPLAQPGVNVAEGEYVIAVDGVPLDVSANPWAAFEGRKGTVSLTIASSPRGEGAREVVVDLLTRDADDRLRHLAWAQAKRRRVDERTGGRVGYIYVPDTGWGGQNELVRQFMGQLGKDGLVIDERFNSGGQIPDRFVELLGRKRYNYWAVRDGKDWPWPMQAHDGPQVMLINGWSGSGGDAFPFYFREDGLGPLIGTRTWGGLIGISGAPGLIDGGGVTVPTFSIYSMKGEWIIESHGVEPDIEVVDDPALMVDGTDPQLERAIDEVLRLMKESPPVRPVRPDCPTR